MIHQTKCKFCHKPIELEIYPDYDAIGDPNKLLTLAACNRCADMREKKRKLEFAIDRICTSIGRAGVKIKGDVQASYKVALTNLTKQYAGMIAQHINAREPAWESECVELLMERPGHWPQIISQLWKLYK